MADRTESRRRPPARRDAAKEPAPRTRAPEATRERLLTAAFAEIHRRGYQAASLDAILASAGVTKGALYHHFTDKAALGHAVIDEVVVGLTVDRWTAPLTREDVDPVDAIKGALRAVADEFTSAEAADRVELGCPLNNLTQEMSPLDESFRRQLLHAFTIWTDAFAGALERARAQRIIRPDVEPNVVATFVIASIEGSFGLAKNARRAEIVRANLDILCDYLDSLRVADSARPVKQPPPDRRRPTK